MPMNMGFDECRAFQQGVPVDDHPLLICLDFADSP